MQIRKYGIVLERLTAADLETVRVWRNSDPVRLSMMFQEIITPAMQVKWFSNLEEATNFYFIIKTNDVKIGLINLKDINWESKTTEAGIFIGEKGYLNTLLPMLATISIMEYAFEELKLNTLKAKIATSNFKAILFNESIGYEKCSDGETSDFNYYQTNELKFKDATKNIRATLDKLK
jgi:UDP-4-amino-4,6-dideoxy-N-acetyl-beta-L-altrosamine N-acetyltransferase